MRFPSSGRLGRRLRAALMLCALFAAALAASAAPSLVAAAALVAAAVFVWDRAALAANLRGLATAVVEADDAKLEVAEGAWGELCHALNRLLQQRRAELQLRHLLPALPAAGSARLAELRPPPEGLACELAVLAIGYHGTSGDPVASMRELAYAALHQAQLHDALLARWGEGVVLIFGALAPQGGAMALRGAHQAARAIGAVQDGVLPVMGQRLTLAAGRGRVVILPGLGLTVVGPPVEQALTLQGLAPGAPLVCNEDAYLGLRRQGVIPPVEAPYGPFAARLPAADGRPPAFALPL